MEGTLSLCSPTCTSMGQGSNQTQACPQGRSCWQKQTSKEGQKKLSVLRVQRREPSILAGGAWKASRNHGVGTGIPIRKSCVRREEGHSGGGGGCRGKQTAKAVKQERLEDSWSQVLASRGPHTRGHRVPKAWIRGRTVAF